MATKNNEAEQAKAAGNAAFKAKDYAAAIGAYSRAIAMDSSSHVFRANRAAAHLGAQQWAAAEADAARCVAMEPSFIKGHFRLATALAEQGEWKRACAALRAGAKHDGGGGRTKAKGTKAVFTPKVRRRFAEAAFCADAEAALGAGDFDAAAELARAGQEVDFRNEALAALMRRAVEGGARARRASFSALSAPEQLKAQGNEAFRESRYDEAARAYTAALAKIGVEDKSSALALSCFNNRAACYQQVSDFGGVVDDCCCVLRHENANEKALLRRGLAYEGLQRFDDALKDMRKLLYINSRNSTANLCKNRIQDAMRRAVSN
jgi:stress-induced-phosphoprotein 1